MASRARSIRRFSSSTARLTRTRLGRPASLAPPAPDHPLPVGRDEPEVVSGRDHLPAALVDEAVVVVAQRQHLVQVGVAAVIPEVDVMRVAPPDRPVATGPAAVLVPGFQASPLCRLCRALG